MIAQLYAALASDAKRNELIIGDVVATIREGRSPLVLNGAQRTRFFSR